MDELFYDRFSGELCDLLPPSRTVLGRWLLRVPPSKDVFLNSVPAQSREFLVPELSGSWRVVDGEGSVQEGKMFRKLNPEEVEAESIRTMGRHLDDLIGAKATWRNWLKVVPLVPGMSDTVDLLPLEHLIRELFGHLEAVCMKPTAHLHVEVERVPVAKARRLPIKAASYLASHTEDWERPLIRGVLPKRILSEVRHDQIDIYENRVSARLIDHLIDYLGKRIRKIKKLLKVFQDKEDYSNEAIGTYLLQGRIFELWGQSIDENEGRKKAETTLKKLERLKYRLMGLLDSPLYQDIPRRAYVAPTLRTTNILANDQNYRRVAELWRVWVAEGHAKTKTPADVNREMQELCRGFVNFSLLLVVRALDQLGYKIQENERESPMKMPGTWELEKHGTRLICAWDEAGRIRIEMGEINLTFISIPASLAAARTDEQVREVVDQVLEATDEQIGRIIILYVGDSEKSQSKLSPLTQRQIYTVGNDPRAQISDRIGFLPVSPWDIGSVERVGRAIRWFADSIRFNSYPLEISVSPEARGVLDMKTAGAWLETSDEGGTITMRRPPREYEWVLLNLDEKVGAACEAHQQAVDEHERLSNELRNAVRKGKTGTLNQKKQEASQRKETTKQGMAAVKRLQDDLSCAFTKAEALLLCPACGTTADPGSDFEPRADACFHCACRDCKTIWEIRICENGHRYAVMRPGKFVNADDSVSGWEDRFYGSDLLAIPGRTANGSWGFVCPKCGTTA
jgi:hypothetical protein